MSTVALTPIAASEWLKLRSIRSTWWFLGGAVALMLMAAALDANGTAHDQAAVGAPAGSVEVAAAAVHALGWVQFVLGSLAMLVMTSEYATRNIVVALACTPSRPRLLLAKAVTVSGVVFAVTVPMAVLAVAVSEPLLGKYADFDAGKVAAQILAMGVYMALIAILALGLGTLIRRSAGTLTALFVLLMVLPIMLQGFADAPNLGFLNTVAEFTPNTAGQRFMTDAPAYGLVVAAWAGAALAAALRMLRVRDA